MKKLLSLALVIFFLATPVKSQDLTQLDFPLLIGDWYWFSSDQSTSASGENAYKAINISFNSDFRFSVKLLKRDGSVEEAVGVYDLDESTLVLSDDYGETQRHFYKLNHNQLSLQGAQFTKVLPNNLSGTWHSNVISGKDVDERVSDLALVLRPDFLFSVKVSGVEGRSVTHRGVYYLEDDHLVLIYRGGQQDSVFELQADTLKLSNNQFGMEAVLERN
ncbi:hypothetical protein [Enterovibrio nigricans]|uniref:Lipocalin-like domain-containing protein n=1 Tax=Enterovibrio nigricans DSM 22720 TaxID=1121868 RepID=A0A1T4UL39_9GAMM|nr:hypothetical protein [Enterovibrio nigricans]PKF50753.1 hypothetical protein AT251_09100 [Enterovibrio nigricans]SKA53492.1 hypothetical protein SAMN02745132_01986 [Enterovibrio nigricans DSM 22720]